MTERWLGDVKPRGGSSEVTLLRDGDEVAQQSQIELIDRRNLPIRPGFVLDLSLSAPDTVADDADPPSTVIETLTAPSGTFVLPGDAVFPESIGVVPETGVAYLGSLADGTIYRLDPSGGAPAEPVSPAGTDGRRSVAGVKIDGRGRLWAAGGYEGTLHVYNLDPWALIARHDVGARPSCANDVAFGPDGAAYLTDSLIPTLFRVDPEGSRLEAFADLAGQGVPWPDGLNLNGIVAAPDGAHLVTCQTNTGRFWRVALSDGAVDEVALDAGPLPHCDGLAIVGSTVYAAINARNEIAVIDLSRDGAAGTVARVLRGDAFRFPTAVAAHGDRLLVVNGQLDRMGSTPELPFTVVAVER
jgi:Cu-Zn family superoxide dismutase